MQKIYIHFLFAVDNIPQVLANFVGILNTNDFKPLGIVMLVHMLYHTQQNGSTVCVGKS